MNVVEKLRNLARIGNDTPYHYAVIVTITNKTPVRGEVGLYIIMSLHETKQDADDKAKLLVKEVDHEDIVFKVRPLYELHEFDDGHIIQTTPIFENDELTNKYNEQIKQRQEEEKAREEEALRIKQSIARQKEEEKNEDSVEALFRQIYNAYKFDEKSHQDKKTFNESVSLIHQLQKKHPFWRQNFHDMLKERKEEFLYDSVVSWFDKRFLSRSSKKEKHKKKHKKDKKNKKNKKNESLQSITEESENSPPSVKLDICTEESCEVQNNTVENIVTATSSPEIINIEQELFSPRNIKQVKDEIIQSNDIQTDEVKDESSPKEVKESIIIEEVFSTNNSDEVIAEIEEIKAPLVLPDLKSKFTPPKLNLI